MWVYLGTCPFCSNTVYFINKHYTWSLCLGSRFKEKKKKKKKIKLILSVSYVTCFSVMSNEVKSHCTWETCETIFKKKFFLQHLNLKKNKSYLLLQSILRQWFGCCALWRVVVAYFSPCYILFNVSLLCLMGPVWHLKKGHN